MTKCIDFFGFVIYVNEHIFSNEIWKSSILVSSKEGIIIIYLKDKTNILCNLSH
jgi:hypothetical protein